MAQLDYNCCFYIYIFVVLKSLIYRYPEGAACSSLTKIELKRAIKNARILLVLVLLRTGYMSLNLVLSV